MDTFYFRWLMTTLVVTVGAALVGPLSVLAIEAVCKHIAAAWPLRRLRGAPRPRHEDAAADLGLRAQDAAPAS